MRTVTDKPMHTPVDSVVDNVGRLASRLSQPGPGPPGLELTLLWWISERVSGQVQPRPSAVHELVEAAGQALLEIVVFGPGADGFLDVGEAVDAERHGPHLPAVTLRAVVPALHRSHLARTGIARNRLPVRPLPFRTPRVPAGARVLPVGRFERVEDERPLIGG